MKQTFEFYTQYNQFYIADKTSNYDTGSDSFWTDEAISQRLAIGNGIIGIGTYSYGYIKGEIKVIEKPEDFIDYHLYDNIVEGGITISSEELEILDCPDSNVELSLRITPGNYRVRVYGSNFSTVEEPDLAKDTDNDYYKIEIWPDNNMERKVLKQYVE
ncbi:hypothetical protein [Flavobacterium sp.]|uniref:hypothetical protein n=1 Tax=Flavobacterium sp. TaxID=239 RepID=UPI004033AF71